MIPFVCALRCNILIEQRVGTNGAGAEGKVAFKGRAKPFPKSVITNGGFGLLGLNSK